MTLGLDRRSSGNQFAFWRDPERGRKGCRKWRRNGDSTFLQGIATYIESVEHSEAEGGRRQLLSQLTKSSRPILPACV